MKPVPVSPESSRRTFTPLTRTGKKMWSVVSDRKLLTAHAALHIDIAAGRWLYFRAEATASDRDINRLYEKILFTFLPASIYSKDTRPNIEVFHPDGSFDIMIPVTVKKPM